MTDTRVTAFGFRTEVADASTYDYQCRPGLLADYGEICRDLVGADARLVVLTDERVDRLYGGRLRESLHTAGLEPAFLAVPEGEKSKCLASFERLLDDLAQLRMDRRGLLVNFGGGVISDLGGFVASAYMRGIQYANFSTSLIGQVDASVGGKVAVNCQHAKNMIGAFHHPVHVACDPALLGTLSKRDFRSGMAEAIKVAVIASADLFATIERQVDALQGRDPVALTDVIGLAAKLKMDLINLDPYENDLRRPLNFGHTLGHPIETEFAYAKVRHGEAVAVGMTVATFIALHKGVIDQAAADRVLAVLTAYDLIGCAPAIHAEAVVEHLRYVKMIRGNHLHFVLPTAIGDVLVTEDVSHGDLLRGFAEYEQLCIDRGLREED